MLRVCRVLLFGDVFVEVVNPCVLPATIGEINLDAGGCAVHDTCRHRRNRCHANRQHCLSEQVVEQRRLAGTDAAEHSDFEALSRPEGAGDGFR
jgi:hypothetical protein